VYFLGTIGTEGNMFLQGLYCHYEDEDANIESRTDYEGMGSWSVNTVQSEKCALTFCKRECQYVLKRRLERTHNCIDTEITYACPSVIVDCGHAVDRFLPVLLFE